MRQGSLRPESRQPSGVSVRLENCSRQPSVTMPLRQPSRQLSGSVPFTIIEHMDGRWGHTASWASSCGQIHLDLIGPLKTTMKAHHANHNILSATNSCIDEEPDISSLSSEELNKEISSNQAVAVVFHRVVCSLLQASLEQEPSEDGQDGQQEHDSRDAAAGLET